MAIPDDLVKINLGNLAADSWTVKKLSPAIAKSYGFKESEVLISKQFKEIYCSEAIYNKLLNLKLQ